jgi:N-acetylglucosaminyldiphosphoundecaprenol N-acetyl-beta-D-mannosaminyltransferase
MAMAALSVQKSPPRLAERMVPRPVREARQRIDLGDILIDRVSSNWAIDRIRDFLRSGKTNQIVTVNLDFVAIARRDPGFRETLNGADLAVADGMPLVWVSCIGGDALPQRLPGVELVDACCALAPETEASVFLLGAEPGVAGVAADRLRERFPGLRIVGAYGPPFGPLSEAENQRILQTIATARPDFLFVALGAPRQEQWIHQNKDRLDVPVCVGVGCVLDVLAGVVSRAPTWMQHAGLEWLFRLLQEPGRLWRRYIVDDVPALVWLIRQTLVPPRPVGRSAPAVLAPLLTVYAEAVTVAAFPDPIEDARLIARYQRST